MFQHQDNTGELLLKTNMKTHAKATQIRLFQLQCSTAFKHVHVPQYI